MRGWSLPKGVDTMPNMEQTTSEILELTDAELEGINGGNWLGDIGRWVVARLKGDGDVRRSTDRPS
jgi:hypothetical protein